MRKEEVGGLDAVRFARIAAPVPPAMIERRGDCPAQLADGRNWTPSAWFRWMVLYPTAMNLESLVSAWPNIDGKIAASSLKQVDRSSYPELERYSRGDIYRDIQGEGGLFLASDMARALELRPGMNVLDLACGTGETSVFLARNYGVNVFAVDKLLDDSKLSARAESEGAGDPW